MDDAERGANATLTVDLESQTITGPDGGEITFESTPSASTACWNGLDDIGLTLEKAAQRSIRSKPIAEARSTSGSTCRPSTRRQAATL
jgi:3-isopropylmalate/(R)-2-methylmalate dehydratase small subunit